MDWVASSCGVVEIPEGIPFEQAAFLEPVNTVLKGVKMLNLQTDDTVLVIGQGPIGLMHAVLASRTGARVLTSDLYAERHAIAAKYGLKDPIHAGSENVVERVHAETDGRGADAVILAVGGNALIRTAIDAGPLRGQGDAVRSDTAWRRKLRPRGSLYGREDSDGVVLVFVWDSQRSDRPGV